MTYFCFVAATLSLTVTLYHQTRWDKPKFLSSFVVWTCLYW